MVDGSTYCLEVPRWVIRETRLYIMVYMTRMTEFCPIFKIQTRGRY